MSEQAKKDSTVIDALSKVSGLSRPTIREIAEQVKVNVERLKSCPGPHDLEDITPEKPFDKKHRCRKCQGEIRSNDVHWYERGLAHARAESASKIAELEESLVLARRRDPLVEGIARSERGRE